MRMLDEMDSQTHLLRLFETKNVNGYIFTNIVISHFIISQKMYFHKSSICFPTCISPTTERRFLQSTRCCLSICNMVASSEETDLTASNCKIGLKNPLGIHLEYQKTTTMFIELQGDDHQQIFLECFNLSFIFMQCINILLTNIIVIYYLILNIF